MPSASYLRPVESNSSLASARSGDYSFDRNGDVASSRSISGDGRSLSAQSGKLDCPDVTASMSALPRQPLSVFNYEGGDRTQSRSHLQSLMMNHHNIMSAHSDAKMDDREKKKVSKIKRRITVNLQGTRYDIVKEVVENLGYSVSKDDDPHAFLLWNDTYVASDRITELKSFQRINHFPGMGEICRKDCLARNMVKMQKSHPEEYNFVPKTWILPQEYNVLQNYAKDLKKRKKHKFFIAKPSNGAMGNGISLFHNAEKIAASEHYVVQEYIERPFLIDNFKCDLRIYVLMSSCDPLKLFLFNDGLVRMGTEMYKDPSPQNVDILFMHLTNYSINKHSETYEKGKSVDTGSKRSLKFFKEYMHHHQLDVNGVWANITDVIVKTMICALPHVHHAYKMCRPGQPQNSESVCFEILGFDIMLDRKLKPWLLEVNRSPSFGTNEQIDYDIKSALLTDTLKLVNIRAGDKKKNIAAQKAATQRRLLQPKGRLDDDDKRKGPGDRRREELKELLARIRKEDAKTSYEDRNCGRFRRIFPAEEKCQQEKYAKMILSAFNNLVIGKNGLIAKEIERMYLKKYREDEVLDMLDQYESVEPGLDGRLRSRGPAPLQGMPSSSMSKVDRGIDHEGESDEDTETDEESVEKPKLLLPARSSSRAASSRPGSKDRPRSSVTTVSRPGSIRQKRGSSMNREISMTLSLAEESAAVNRQIKEKEEELSQIVLSTLNEMKIKFPGKTDEQAQIILNQLQENWKFHKPRVASYWLVKLDSIKRRKVIDIVRSNVRAKIQHIYQTHDVEGLRLYRIFSRVFNRLLWSHGQGLWHCFTQSGNSWETIFSKSTDVISSTEMECGRRTVQLCKDCLLIVYQFATEAKAQQAGDRDIAESENVEASKPINQHWQPSTNLSQRYSRMYTSNPYYKLTS